MAPNIAECSQARNGAAYGVNVSSVEVDFGRVMQRMRQLRAEISHVDSAGRFRDLGIDVYQVSVASALPTRSQRLSHQHAHAPNPYRGRPEHALDSAVHGHGRLPVYAP